MRVAYLFIAGIIVVGLVGYWYFFLRTPTLPGPRVFEEGFETGMGDWAADYDLPQDPNNPGSVVAWNVTRVTDPSYSGNYSLRLYVDGRQDDGTVWIERTVPVERGFRVQINVSFQLYSEAESFNTLAAVVGYAGLEDPEAEGDFGVIGPADQVAGWKLYSFSGETPTGGSGEVWVALGVSVRWETDLFYPIDEVKVETSYSR